MSDPVTIGTVEKQRKGPAANRYLATSHDGKHQAYAATATEALRRLESELRAAGKL